jgi:hypothetical protein
METQEKLIWINIIISAILVIGGLCVIILTIK